MPCTVSIVDLKGREVIPSFTVSNEENAKAEIEKRIQTVLANYAPDQITTLINNINNVENEGIDIASVRNMLYSKGFQIFEGFKSIDFESVYDFVANSDLIDNIKLRVEYLQNKNKQVRFLLAESDSLTISRTDSKGNVSYTDFDGTIIPSDNGIIYVVLKNGSDTDLESLATTMNHELEHIVMNSVIEEDKEIQNKLLNLFNSLKKSNITDASPKVKNIIRNLGNYRGSDMFRATEIWAWVFGDQDVFDYVSGKNISEFADLATMTEITPRGKKKEVLDSNNKSDKESQVAELFESNPELANAVYEALGFETTTSIPNHEVVTRPAKDIGKSKGRSGNFVEITTPDNYRTNMSAYMVQTNDDGKLFITNIEKYNEDSTFKGFGTVAYVDFFENYKNQGITTDKQLTADGIKLLERLEKIGLVYKTNAKLIDDTVVSKIYNTKIYEYDKPLYEFNLNWSRNQITPKQKKQAQKIYSQYLDTIFPSKPEQLHTLGSKQDVERFKNYVANQESLDLNQKVNNNKIKLEIVDRYTDSEVKANPNKIYVFGDNVKRTGTGGQAQIRNNPNAFGIATKLKPSNRDDAFMSDDDLESNKKIIDSDIQKILNQNKPLVFPKDGFGTGLAKLKEKAPKTYEYLKKRLKEEFYFDNDEGKIIDTESSAEITTISSLQDIERRRADEIKEYSYDIVEKVEDYEFTDEEGNILYVQIRNYKDGSRKSYQGIEKNTYGNVLDNTPFTISKDQSTEDYLKTYEKWAGTKNKTGERNSKEANLEGRKNKINAKYDAELSTINITDFSQGLPSVFAVFEDSQCVYGKKEDLERLVTDPKLIKGDFFSDWLTFDSLINYGVNESIRSWAKYEAEPSTTNITDFSQGLPNVFTYIKGTNYITGKKEDLEKLVTKPELIKRDGSDYRLNYHHLTQYRVNDTIQSWVSEKAKENDDLPFALTHQEALEDFDFAESADLKEALEFKKNKTKEEIKASNEKIYDVLTNDYKKRVDNNTLGLEYEESISTEGDTNFLYGAKTGDIVQIPYDDSRYWKTWKNYFTDEQMAQLWPGNTYSDNDYVTINIKKLHDFFEGYTGTIKDKLKKKLDYIKKESLHTRVKNYPLVYITKNDGNPQVIVPYSFEAKDGTVYKSTKKFSFSDVVGIRKFKGNYNESLQATTQQKINLDKYLNELSETTEYVKGMDFRDDDTQFLKNVIYNGVNGSFEATYIQTKNKTQIGGIKGKFGSLRGLLQGVDAGTFVKFAKEYVKGKGGGSGKFEMVYGQIIGKGASSSVILYKEGNEYKTKNVPHYKITELYLPEGTNADIFEQLNNSGLAKLNEVTKDLEVNERKKEFGDFMSNLYKRKGKRLTIHNFNYIANSILSKEGKTQADVDQSRLNILKKAKMGNIVKYVHFKDNTVKELVGEFFYADDEHAYIRNGYGEIIKISIKNSVSDYDKTKKSRTFIRGKSIDKKGVEVEVQNNFALDTMFSDMTKEATYVDYLKGIKNIIKSSFENETDPNNQKDSIKKDIETGAITGIELLNLYKTFNTVNASSMNDVVDVIEFTTYDKSKDGKTVELDSVLDLLTKEEQKQELAKLRVGDLIHYYNIYDGNKLYNNWTIIVDFDAVTGYPIIAYETENKIVTQVVKVDKIKAIGKQINPISQGMLQITGRPEIRKRRDEIKEQFVNQKSGIMTLTDAKKHMDKKKGVFKSMSIAENNGSIFYTFGNKRYEIYPLNYVTDKDGNQYFTKVEKATKESLELVKKLGIEQMYGVRTQFKKKGEDTWSKGWSQMEYQIANNEQFGVNEYDFDTIKKGCKFGTILEVEKTYINKDGENKKYYTMLVEKTTNNMIKGSVIYRNKETGKVEEFPMNIYRTGRVKTVVRAAYNVDYKAFEKADRDKEKNKEGITVIKKSEIIKKLNKSRDNKRDISRALVKLNEIYGVNSEMLNTESMIMLGKSLGQDLSKARGIVKDGKIYINGDIASTAEAFHEMGHLIVPGLQKLNPEAWNLIKTKVKLHPTYQIIAERYSSLSEEDLVEEAFITIFGEYYRKVYMSQSENQWFKDNESEFNGLSEKSSELIADIFDLDQISEISPDVLMNMSLNQIMIKFGNAMMNGGLNVYLKNSSIIASNSLMQKLFDKLIDEGILINMC